jgi:hypothetical protein
MSEKLPTPLEAEFDGQVRGEVTLTVPARPEYFLLARLNASGVASMLDFDVEAIEDLKLAVSELCSLCAVGTTPASRMSLRYRWDAGSIEISCECGPVHPTGEQVDEAHPDGIDPLQLGERLLAALVDEHLCQPLSDDTRRAVLRKRRASNSESRV